MSAVEAKPVHVTSEESFRQLTASGGLVCVDFFATWCGPCKQIAPFFAILAQKYAHRVRFLKVDVDKLRSVAATYNIKAMPTFKLLLNGRVLGEVKGADPSGLEAMIKANLKHAARPEEIPPGTRIVLRGLKAESVNGSIGTVLGGLQAGESERYPITFTVAGKQKKAAVRRCNMLQILPFAIERKSGKQDVKDATAAWDAGNSAYRVWVPGQEKKDQEDVFATPDELRLPDGCRVRVVGLAKAPKYNGSFAMVCGFDEATSRYVVDFGAAASKRVKIRAANLRVE